MKTLLAGVVGLFVLQGVAFSRETPAPRNDVLEKAREIQPAVREAAPENQQITQAAAEHAQAVKNYPAWLVNSVAAEFTAVLDAGNRFLAAPSPKNWELFNAAKKEHLQQAGIHICKFYDASQAIGDEERKKLGDQLLAMMDTFWKNEKALEVQMDGVLAQQQRQQEKPIVTR